MVVHSDPNNVNEVSIVPVVGHIDDLKADINRQNEYITEINKTHQIPCIGLEAHATSHTLDNTISQGIAYEVEETEKDSTKNVFLLFVCGIEGISSNNHPTMMACVDQSNILHVYTEVRASEDLGPFGLIMSTESDDYFSEVVKTSMDIFIKNS